MSARLKARYTSDFSLQENLSGAWRYLGARRWYSERG